MDAVAMTGTGLYFASISTHTKSIARSTPFVPESRNKRRGKTIRVWVRCFVRVGASVGEGGSGRPWCCIPIVWVVGDFRLVRGGRSDRSARRRCFCLKFDSLDLTLT
ncbi:hypothetical protein CCHR01_02377 [Colletotrichum chrysophilum]|uniref:Uncharacterized protein n=1 Tax=Colletotrichum chrysophilum TaxID=1836956 RepID=A0AAD9AVR1_9PEZI|nr:hypothetical protein CCHR01_02377 [Colletotrichum chrysophilum]